MSCFPIEWKNNSRNSVKKFAQNIKISIFAVENITLFSSALFGLPPAQLIKSLVVHDFILACAKALRGVNMPPSGGS